MYTYSTRNRRDLLLFLTLAFTVVQCTIVTQKQGEKRHKKKREEKEEGEGGKL